MSSILSHGFEPGALYSRKVDIHGRFGGQVQGGISTPADYPVLILFTGESGKGHGYDDYWDDEGYFHYVGEGQRGDMEVRGGNRAIADQPKTNKAILLFQSMGKGKPYRFIDEFLLNEFYFKDGVPDTDGHERRALVFKLSPIARLAEASTDILTFDDVPLSTVVSRVVEVRTKQRLFRNRVERIEKGCRVTTVTDARFLRASHMKPWSRCADNAERTDGNNGLLLAPHLDMLFNDGWISFTDDAKLIVSDKMPIEVMHLLNLRIRDGEQCGKAFNERQRFYLAFHREHEFRRL